MIDQINVHIQSVIPPWLEGLLKSTSHHPFLTNVTTLAIYALFKTK